jgi:predicted ribosomally synthesized peptide with SipW-like signal peptide
MNSVSNQETSRRKRAKEILLALLGLGVLASLVSSGTFASFNATLTQTSGITTGVLVLGNTTDAAAECFSSGASITTNSAACSTAPSIFSGAIGSGTPQFHNLTIRNAGDITNALLNLSATACNDIAAPVNGYSGANPACPSVQFMVAEVASFSPGAGPTAVTTCYFGDSTKTFSTPGPNNFTGCGFGTLPATSLDGAGGFDKVYTTTANGLNLGPLTTTGRKFILGAVLPNAASTNAMMGRSMSTTFTWFAQ